MKVGRKPKYKIVYNGIREYMESREMSLRELSEITGVCVNNLHAVLIGGHEPNKKTIDRILNGTGMTYEEAFNE